MTCGSMGSAMYVLGGVSPGLGEIVHSSDRVHGWRQRVTLTHNRARAAAVARECLISPRSGCRPFEPGRQCGGRTAPSGEMPVVRRLTPTCRTLPVWASVADGNRHWVLDSAPSR